MSKLNTKSPCIGVCKRDFNNMCIGCFRTLEEIAMWRTMSPQQKHEINIRVNTKLKVTK